MAIDFKAVSSRLTALDFARREGLQLRGKRAQCPFHGGEHFNLQFFDNGCYCHVCHKGGDVIALAAAMWNVDSMTAAQMLNEQYSLGLDGGSAAQNAQAMQARRRAQDQRRNDAQRERDQWGAACDRERATGAAMAGFSAQDAQQDSPALEAAWRAFCAAQRDIERLQLEHELDAGR